MLSAPADVRLLSTDFDGTIHQDFVRPGIPAALQRKLAELQRIGVVWVINTGRDMASLMESLHQADIWVRPDYVVLVEREIFRREGREYVPVEPWNSQCTRDHLELFARLEQELAALKEHLSQNHGAQFYEDTYSPICASATDNSQMDAIEAGVREVLRAHPEVEAVRNSIYLRLAHRGYSKGTALAELQRLLRIDPEFTLVAGDHLNDLPMMDRTYSRYLITPHNSVPPVRTKVRQHGGYLAQQAAGMGILEGFAALGV
jgi:hypothetical protein